MQSAKDKAKEAKEKEKQANAQSKPSGAYVTIMHKDEKLIVGDCLYKYFSTKESQKLSINFYYEKKTGKATINAFKNDILPEGLVYSYCALELSFSHAAACPSNEFQKLKNCLFEKPKNYIGVAASGLVIDKNSQKECQQCDLFRMPGKVDAMESIEETVLREIKEETGIYIEKDNEEKMMDEEEELFRKNVIKCSHIKPFFLWESVYPTSLKYGFPQNQFLVIFFVIKLMKSCEEIKVKLQEKEVERIVWIEGEKLYEVVSNESKITPPKFLNEMVKTYSSSNEILEFPLVIFMDSYPNSFGEGLGEGHREALKEFVEKQRKSKL